MFWIFGLPFVAAQICFGLAIFGFLDPKKKFTLLEFFLSAATVGILAGAYLILLIALATNSLYSAIFISLVFVVSTIILRLKEVNNFFNDVIKAIKNIEKPSQLFQVWSFLLFLIILAYAGAISLMLVRNSAGVLKSTLPGWGDTALHISMINKLATSDPFELSHPLMGGVNLTYPFMVNFISAVFSKLGAGQLLAFRLPLYIFGVAWIILLFSLASRLLKSKYYAVLALVLIFWGSGFGFMVLREDLQRAYDSGGLAGIGKVFAHPPHEYTHLDNRTGGKQNEKDTDDNIVWMVPAVSFLSHQRSFVLGLTLFTIILLGITYYGWGKSFWRFGAVAGISPFVHGHTFIALFILMAALFLFFRKNWLAWILFALLAAVLALPQIYYFLSSSNIASVGSFRPWFGWMTCDHNISWFSCDSTQGVGFNTLVFWIKNFGVIFIVWALVIFIAVVKLLFSYISIGARNNAQLDHKFLAASFALFAAPNLFLFQPWPFDNNKVFFYWWIIAILFAVIPALQFIAKRKLAGKILAVMLIFFGVLAGGFDSLYRLLGSRESNYYGYADDSQKNIELASWIRLYTKPNDRFLTNVAVDPVPIFLAGRPVYLAYEGWLWSQGLDYYKNTTNAKTIVGGDTELACDEKIKFIILDKNLQQSFPTTDETALLSKTKIVFEQTSPDRKVLEIPCLEL